MPGDIQADVGSVERPWREGGCMFVLVFCFAVGGEVFCLFSLCCPWKQAAAGGSFSCVISSWGVGRWVGVCVGSLAVCVYRAGVPRYRA